MKTLKHLFHLSILMIIFTLPAYGNAQQQKISRRDLQHTNPEQYVSKTEMQEITLEKNQKAPVHYHPCPVIGIVRSGKILFQLEGEKQILLNEGDTFYEPKNIKVLHFDNVSDSKQATFIAIYLIERNEKTIQMVD